MQRETVCILLQQPHPGWRVVRAGAGSRVNSSGIGRRAGDQNHLLQTQFMISSALENMPISGPEPFPVVFECCFDLWAAVLTAKHKSPREMKSSANPGRKWRAFLS